MFIMLEATEKSTMLGDIFVATGAVLILMVLIKKFAWGAITNIFEQRAKKYQMILMVQKQLEQRLKSLLSVVKLNFQLAVKKLVKF